MRESFEESLKVELAYTLLINEDRIQVFREERR